MTIFAVRAATQLSPSGLANVKTLEKNVLSSYNHDLRKSHTFSQCFIRKNTIIILDFCMISLEDGKKCQLRMP